MKDNEIALLGSASLDESMESVMVESTEGPATQRNEGRQILMKNQYERNDVNCFILRSHTELTISIKQCVSIHYPVVGIDIQVRDSSVALQESLEIGHVVIYYHSNLVSTFQLLEWYVVSVTGFTSGDYSEVIRSISSRVEHVSNVAAHTSIAYTINLTPQTMLKYLSRTEQCPWCDKSSTNL